MEKLKKAKSVLISKDVNAVCVTSDGSVFHAKDKIFADAHSQRFDDETILIVGKNDEFKKENKNLFFKGSRFSFQLANEKTPGEPKGDETPGEPKGDEPKGDEPTGDKPKGDEPRANDEMSVKVLKSMAKDIDGYKSSMNKAELIELINLN
jgi:hypothetical protein